MPKRVFDTKTGKLVWVGDDGRPISLSRVNPGLGSLPGRAEEREEALLGRLPDAQIAGYYGPGVVPVPKQPGARPEAPTPPRPETYRPLAGLRENNRGATVEIRQGAEGQNSVSSIVETPRNNGEDAEDIILTLGFEWGGTNAGSLTPEPGSSESALIETFCQLTWGIGGASFFAEFDWQKGARIPLNASFVRVGARIENQVDGFNPVPDIYPLLTASLSYGSLPPSRSHTPRLTQRVATTAGQFFNPGAPVYYEIPRFATAFTFLSSDPSVDLSFAWRNVNPVASPSLGVYLRTYGGGRFNMNENGRTEENIFPIPGQANFLSVTNNAARTTGLSILWMLGL